MNTPPDSALTRSVDWLIRQRLPIFILGLVATLAATWWASQLSFDQSIEALYADDDPYLIDYVRSKKQFGGDELAGVVFSDPELFSPEGLERVRNLAERLSAIPGIRAESTQDLSTGLSRTTHSRLPFLRKRTRQVLDFFRGILVGDDDQTTAVVLRFEAREETHLESDKFAERRKDAIESIRTIAAEHQERFGFPTFVVGEPVQVNDMFRYVQDDGATLGWASLVLLVGVILLLFRSLRWVVLPVLIVQATLLWTKAILVLSRTQLTMVSSILESLITIIGVATVMHISLIYCELRPRFDRVGALRETLVMLARDIFWVCATTAGGFAAQLSSHVYPVQSFGFMMTLGSMLVLVAIGVLLPGGVLLGRHATDPNVGIVDRHLGNWLMVLVDWVERYPWRLMAGCTLVAVVSLAGMWRIRMETDFSRNFRQSSPIVQALNYVEQHLGGAGTWEVNFPAPETLDEEFLDRVSALAEQLRGLAPSYRDQQTRLTKVLALSDGLDLIPQIPLIANTVTKRVNLLSTFQPEFVSSLYNPSEHRMRIVLRAREQTPAELKNLLINEAERLVREAFPADSPGEQARTTGLFVLLTHLIESLLGDQWSSFGWGAAGIVAMMTVAYRSLRIGLISLIPNLLPIVLVVGTMGWLDLPINIGTAMISGVSMGLTVDASIFYISSFRRMEATGMNFSEALRATQHDIGRALIYSNAALILGFLVLTLSHFIPLVYFGLLVSVAMLGGLAGNLILLPLLMRATRAR